MPESLAQFFCRVTGKDSIVPYQERYGSDPFVSTLLIIPTGLGKTDAVLVPWLYALVHGKHKAPRRFVFIQPRQNLTEQTFERARKLVAAAGLNVRVLQLMGGSEHNDQTVAPDEFVIIVGTQDMILSRVLNRGYARRPQRWPIDFALLNNDAIHIVDEVQLTSDGLATSTQLAAFRKRFEVFGQVPCVWMSATVDPAWLDTVDFAELRAGLRLVKLEPEDHENEIVQKRFNAPKSVAQAPEECRTPKGCAEFALAQHRPGERTLILCNTVLRAREIFEELRKLKAPAVLLHSRYRPAERKANAALLMQGIPKEGQIIVSTQVLEAGIDLSAHRLITDVAPWGSMVQRFGRVNRYGEFDDAQIWWVDQPLASKKRNKEEELFAPYAPADVKHAIGKLLRLQSASPSQLPEEDGAPPYSHVLRKSDLLDLFDTSSDISGNELDVSRFIRSGEENDVYVCWRKWEKAEEIKVQDEVRDDELCPVPIGDAGEFLKKHSMYGWSFNDKEWQRVTERARLYPGLILITRVSEGGYSEQLGWAPDSKLPVAPVEIESSEAEADSDDPKSWLTYRQTLVDHTDMVVDRVTELIESITDVGVGAFRAELITAAQKHDWGKAHDVMQRTLGADGELLAKQERCKAGRHERKHFRHELASALAMLQTGDSDLTAYLAAAHHGRIRVSIRSMPGEAEVGGKRVARGIWDGDLLRACELATGVSVPGVCLSLDEMGLGLGTTENLSWTDRVVRLRDKLGPFRLAYLEMLLRSADEQASELKSSEVAAACTQ
jgi:CRISPR-associated endonuclease/helicase Cas3